MGASPSQASKRRGSKERRGSSAFACPECGREFGRPAALGAHRRQAHGVVGATNSRRVARLGAAAPRAAARPRDSMMRDALLQVLFPSGIPAREDIVRAVNVWLDEAERLTSSR